MPRTTSTVQSFILVAALLLTATPSVAAAQVSYRQAPPRVELTPFGSYQWGGSFDTQSSGVISAGELNEGDSFSWGVIASFMAQRNSAVELWYLRQDTDVTFNPNTGNSRNVGDFSNNYIQLGVRQDLAVGANLKPFITASMGVNILDPKGGDLGSSTRFSWTLGGGTKVMMANQRVGFRLDLRWMVTPVPSNTYGGWCDIWGCYAVEGTDWLHQGSVGGGIVFAF
jgi:opacity protein-like surface antigen